MHNSRGVLNFVLICLFKLLKFFFSNLNQFILALEIKEHDYNTDNLMTFIFVYVVVAFGNVVVNC